MGMIFGLCAVMVLATFAPEIFATAVIAFRAILNKLKELWNTPS
jgi:hypothetical protein